MGTEHLEDVVALERALLDPAVRASRPRLEALLDEDFSEVGASGRTWTRAGVVDMLLAGEPDGAGPVEVEDMRASPVTEGVVLLTYLSDPGARPARRSSLWRKRDGRWRLLHHQGTPAHGAGGADVS